MKIPFVDLHTQYQSIKGEIDAAIAKVIHESAFIRSQFVSDFEQQFAGKIGASRCVSCANGTDALYILFRAFGVKTGDEVITTAQSWISTSETITQAGGRVVFCDINPSTFTIDVEDIFRKTTKKTVGIVPVHLYGQPAEMDEIMRFAKQRGLWVVEDCAQAHFSEYRGKQVGTIGDAAAFSFYPGKNLGAFGDAGCIATNDDKLANWCELFSRHGGKGEHIMEGINSRMDGLQAAILSTKLNHIDEWTKRRRRVAERYDELLAGVPEVVTPIVGRSGTHVYHLYVIRAKRRDELRAHLTKCEVATMLNYSRPLPFYPAYDYLNHTHTDFPHSSKAQQEILSLPIYPEMTEIQIQFVVRSIKEFYGIY